jgi:hypothetical protein
MNYLGGRPGGGGGDIDGSTEKQALDFRTWEKGGWTQRLVAGEFGPLDCEHKVGGYHDFWFVNEQEQAVKAGLDRAAPRCKCSRVELTVLPPERRTRALAAEAALRGVAAAGRWQALLAGPGLYAALQRGLEPVELKQREETTVPAGAIGWVRLGWDGRRLGPDRLSAVLWVGNPERPPTTLGAVIFVHDPVKVENELPVGTLSNDELPRTVSIVAWSSTRPRLNLAARVNGTRSSARDPFEVGRPQPLTSKELAELEKSVNTAQPSGQAGPVLCAYRIPVTLRKVSADGSTPFDIGPFVRWVVVGEADESLTVRVFGRVRGLVEVRGESTSGMVSLSVFLRSRGKKVKVMVQSDAQGLTLKFDRARTPAFLAARLGAPERVGMRGRSWTLEIEVLPERALGMFPRREDPLYEDSAVYLEARQEGKPTRPIRIPVVGTANEG